MPALRLSGLCAGRRYVAERRLANAGCLAHLTYAQPQLMCQPQHLTDLPHRHSHPGHRLPLWFFTGTADLLIRMSMGALAKRSSQTVRNHRNAVRDGQESAFMRRSIISIAIPESGLLRRRPAK